MKDTSPQAVQAAHELLLWLIPQIDKFPHLGRQVAGLVGQAPRPYQAAGPPE